MIPRHVPALPALLALAALAALAAACGGRGAATDEAARVTRVGDRAIGAAEFDRFVRRQTGMAAADLAPAALENLYESLFAEVLLARAGEKAGIKIPPDALEDETARLAALGPVKPEDLQREARRSVMSRAYESTVLAREVRVLPADIDRALAAHGAAPADEEVVFRQILADGAEAAAAARRRIVEGREPFEKVAKDMSQAPDRGARQKRRLSLLPPAAAAVLGRLREGETGQPVSIDGAYYVLRLERRRAPGGSADDREQARQALATARFEQIRQARLAELARAEKVRPPRLADAIRETAR